jgi:hypothetical protein
VIEEKAKKKTEGFTCWEQFVAMPWYSFFTYRG